MTTVCHYNAVDVRDLGIINASQEGILPLTHTTLLRCQPLSSQHHWLPNGLSYMCSLNARVG